MVTDLAVDPARWLTGTIAGRNDLLALADDLRAPPFPMAVETLAERWEIHVVRAVAPCPEGLEDYPEISIRLRGAMGRALHDLPPRFSVTGRERPHAYDVLFSPLVRDAGGDEVPRPLLARAWIADGLLHAEVRLFGDAMAWADDAGPALLMALRGGLALSGRSRRRVAAEPDDVYEARTWHVAVPDRIDYASLTFRSPVTTRLGGRLSGDPRSILRGVLRRVEAMARWQGAALLPPTDAACRALETVAVDARALHFYRATRHSRRQGDRAIPMAGHLGRLVLTGQLAPLVPYLAIAETCNIGSHAGLGFGWYDLALA